MLRKLNSIFQSSKPIIQANHPSPCQTKPQKPGPNEAIQEYSRTSPQKSPSSCMKSKSCPAVIDRSGPRSHRATGKGHSLRNWRRLFSSGVLSPCLRLQTAELHAILQHIETVVLFATAHRQLELKWEDCIDRLQTSGQIFARSTREDSFPVLVRCGFWCEIWRSGFFIFLQHRGSLSRRFTLPSSQCESQQTRAETTAACQHC